MSARVPGVRLHDSFRRLMKFGAYISLSPALGHCRAMDAILLMTQETV
jgi:hypothetical protein